MEGQQKKRDIDDETIHQQAIDVLTTDETCPRQESSNNDNTAKTNNTNNNNNDTWSITTCNKSKLEYDQQGVDASYTKEQQQMKSLFRFWNKLKRRIKNNQSSTAIDPRNFPASKKRWIMVQMMFAAVV